MGLNWFYGVIYISFVFLLSHWEETAFGVRRLLTTPFSEEQFDLQPYAIFIMAFYYS